MSTEKCSRISWWKWFLCTDIWALLFIKGGKIMIYKNEETDAINLFESFLSGIIFDEDKTTLTILIDWKDGSGDTQLERISFVVRYCSKFQCSIRQNEYFKLPLCSVRLLRWLFPEWSYSCKAWSSLRKESRQRSRS